MISMCEHTNQRTQGPVTLGYGLTRSHAEGAKATHRESASVSVGKRRQVSVIVHFQAVTASLFAATASICRLPRINFLLKNSWPSVAVTVCHAASRCLRCMYAMSLCLYTILRCPTPKCVNFRTAYEKVVDRSIFHSSLLTFPKFHLLCCSSVAPSLSSSSLGSAV